jgi:hypothetical protein
MVARVFSGGCHCGALEICFTTEKSPTELPLHACQCSFCRKHGTRTTSDPDGVINLIVNDRQALNKYEFGLKTAQYLVCRHCGIYLGAICAGTDGERALVNVNCLAEQATFRREPEPVSYDEEGYEDRLARRRRNWTPTTWIEPRNLV